MKAYFGMNQARLDEQRAADRQHNDGVRNRERLFTRAVDRWDRASRDDSLRWLYEAEVAHQNNGYMRDFYRGRLGWEY